MCFVSKNFDLRKKKNNSTVRKRPDIRLAPHNWQWLLNSSTAHHKSSGSAALCNSSRSVCSLFGHCLISEGQPSLWKAGWPLFPLFSTVAFFSSWFPPIALNKWTWKLILHLENRSLTKKNELNKKLKIKVKKRKKRNSRFTCFLQSSVFHNVQNWTNLCCSKCSKETFLQN